MYLSEADLRPLLRMEALIPAIRQALVEYSAGRVEQPLRQVMRVRPQAIPEAATTATADGWFATMPAIAGDFMAVKTVTYFPANAARDLPTHMATVTLLSRHTGEPLAVMDGRLITEMRTAAVSAVALEALAWPGARTLGILGAGVQAAAHLEAFRLVWPGFREPSAVRVWSRSADKAAAFAARHSVAAVALEEAAACDVVVTVTGAVEPVLQGRWLGPRALVIAVGAVGAHLRELDDAAMRGTLIVESRQGAENESGDVRLSGARIFAEIGEVLARQTRLSDKMQLPDETLPSDGHRVFKSVGMAIEDLTAARVAWQAWLAAKRP